LPCDSSFFLSRRVASRMEVVELGVFWSSS
jgi:hypothetical protein